MIKTFRSSSIVVRNSRLTHSFSPKQQQMIGLELSKSAHNYHPIPVVLSKGLGVNVWDVDGKVYFEP